MLDCITKNLIFEFDKDQLANEPWYCVKDQIKISVPEYIHTCIYLLYKNP